MVEAPSLWRIVSTRARVCASYAVREFKQHRAGARLGLPFTIIELAVAMVVMAAIFSLIGRQAAFGDSIMLFMLTGFAPFLTFMRITTRAGMAVEVGGHKARSPLLTTPGFAASQALAALVATPIAVGLICMALYAVDVSSAVPVRLGPLVAGFGAVIIFGFGVGLFNATVGHFFKPWRPIYEILTRGLLFLSGVFYVPDFMPVPIREFLAWNPLVHVIALIRRGFFETYPTLVLDVEYLALWVIGALFVGLWTERLCRRSVLA